MDQKAAVDFVEELKSRVEIVSVIGEKVRLRKSGPNRYQGLCPFHTEKTPSFSVHAARQFYYCFGCQAKGDVINFVMEIEGISFYEALKGLAERHGIPMPKRSQYADEDSRLREALFQMHELAQENFRANLAGPAGETARAYLARRGVKPETVEHFGLGYSERLGRALSRLFEQRNFPAAQIEQSGLVRKRDDGTLYDYFRNRLMFPIHNESGKIIGFGGRALAEDDNPKYLNSPETPIYKKSRVLYNLHRAKEAIRKEERAVLVEGYMDAIGVTAAGFRSVVASCGTALTPEQVRALKRHAERIVVNFDPDAAGANATERSINLLLEEGMQVRIVELDGGLDPDEYCKQRGAAAYQQRLDAAKGYFHWLADRARKKYDMRTTEGKVAVLQFLVPAVQRIPDRLERMQIAIEVAGYVGVDQANQGAVLDAFKKSVADRKEQPMRRPVEAVRADEKGLLNVVLSGADGLDHLLRELQRIEVLDRLATRRIYQAVVAAHTSDAPLTFDAVNSRLEPDDQSLLAEVMLSGDTDQQEITVQYGEQCLESLRRSDDRLRRQDLKVKVKEAERAGDLAEALRLAQELQQLERPSGAAG
ncbi:MAG TPA: DNA primase [Bryobacteraceae bacterium]|nr:DNA primase [Bryobacteraceae bacterium]